MLDAVNLSCERGDRTLFAGLEFSVTAGSLLRVAGPNGMGKTSLLRILCALLEPVAGEVRWHGRNIRSQREEYWKDLVYVGHLNGVKEDLTVFENLKVAQAVAGRNVDHTVLHRALDSVGLGPFEHALARRLSQGQRRRVALARLFATTTAPLWILDEPFIALDQRGVASLSERIASHIVNGNMVVLVTHQDVAIDVPRQQHIELTSSAAEAAC
ncbi:MAG TPA: cytochrome c biogenesis heme-transporting ATPase CcmA [Burkholderiaceae bacterium]|nr:cytochrome c biogenesis heme-transporting ATPase CcmA [Burkholderiaceae bacterium]